MLNSHEIARSLSGANPGERRRIIDNLATQHGCSRQAIYKAASRAGFISGRKKRSDAGTREIDLTDHQLSQVAAIIHATHTEKGRIPMPAHTAISLAEAQSIIPAGVLTPSYLNDWMRRQRISKKDALARTPHTRLMSLHPNHVHMVDASICAQWYLADSGEVKHQRRNMDVYKNKDGHGGKLTRLILIDHYTGCFFVWYTLSERALDILEFLYHAWTDKSFLAYLPGIAASCDELSKLFPFRGVPKILYSDNGSPLRAKLTDSVLSTLSVDAMFHKPYNARAKGANETMQRHWERWFESTLKLSPATSLDQLNAWAFDRCLQINSQVKFSRHKRTRFEMFEAHCEGHIKELPDYDIYRNLVSSEPERRKVNYDGTIRFKPRNKVDDSISGLYRVPDVNLRGEYVEVSYNLYHYPNINVVSCKTGQMFELEPLIANEAGFLPDISAVIGQNYKAPAFTESQKALNDLAEVSVANISDLHLPITTFNHYETTASDKVKLAPSTETIVYAKFKAKQLILESVGAKRMDELSDYQRQLVAQIGDTITHADLDKIRDAVKVANSTPSVIMLGEMTS